MTKRITHPQIETEIMGDQDGPGFRPAYLCYSTPHTLGVVVYHKLGRDPFTGVITESID